MASLDPPPVHAGRQTRPSVTETSTRMIVVGAASSEWRRALGPSSWTVLEEMLRRSSGPAEECTAQISIRALAVALGLAKDTVARAVVRLRATGAVTAVQSRGAAGAFDADIYRIPVHPDVLAIVVNDRPICPRLDRHGNAQLSLAIGF